MRKHEELLTVPPRHAGLAMIPSSLLQAGSVRRLARSAYGEQDRTTGETNYCIEEVTHGTTSWTKPRTLLRIRDVMVHGVLPTTALRYNVAVSDLENTWESKKSRLELGDRISHRLTGIHSVILSAMRLFASSWLPLPVQG